MQHQTQENSPGLWGGIECTINRVHDRYFDQLDYSGHYLRPADIDLLARTGIRKMRYPILWERHQPHPDTEIDWTWTDRQLKQLHRNNIDVIAGLVHHGSGPAFTSLLDENFPHLLAGYASKLIERFPQLNFFTPVNEPLTTARFSGLYGFWYPHHRNDRSFLRMFLHQMKGIVLSMQAIRKVNPNAKLVQTEDLGKTYSTKSLRQQATFENDRRWLTYDLLCGRVTREHPLWQYFLENGITERELAFFQENRCVPDVFGFNHYLTSERFLDGRLNRYPKHTHGGNGRQVYADVEAVRVELKEPTGIEVLLTEAWQRYRRPMAVTEVHLHCHREEQLRWFQQVWNACQHLTRAGVQIEAVTAWAMLGSHGWNKLLTEPGGDYEPGVFDVRNGQPRPTALAGFLQQLAAQETSHHLGSDKGWWQRPTRFLRRPVLLHNQIDTDPQHEAPILIVGDDNALANEVGRICRTRFLRCKFLNLGDRHSDVQTFLRKAVDVHRPWAVICTTGPQESNEEPSKADTLEQFVTIEKQLAEIAAEQNIKLVTFSNNQVFDGGRQEAYAEDDAPNPVNRLGRITLKMEQTVLNTFSQALVVRTGALFGPWDENSFANEVRQHLLNETPVSVDGDGTTSFSFLPDLVHATLDLLIDGEQGIWHLANPGSMTWVDFANEIADRFQLNRTYIQPVRSAAPEGDRPLNTALTSKRGLLLPPLEDALRRYAEETNADVQHQKKQLKIIRA